MNSISYLTATFGGIALFGLGWLLNHFIISGKSKDWKAKFLDLEKEHNHLGKQINKEKKQVEQLRQKSESWKHEFHELTQESLVIKKDHRASMSALEDQNKSVRAELSNIKSEKDRSVAAHDKLKIEHEKLKEKYKKDVAAGTEWRTERDRLTRDLKSTTERLEKSQVIANEYRGKYDKQAEEINKIRVMEREIRSLNTKVKKLEQDCEYWEKKHYDAHHELASLKENIVAMQAKYDELAQLRKGDEILKANLMEQISEFKTKFVNVNNKYRDLVSNN